MSRYGGFVKGYASGSKPGLPCVYACGNEVNISGFNSLREKIPKTRIVKKGDKKKYRPNPGQKLLISRAVCSDCLRKGLK